MKVYVITISEYDLTGCLGKELIVGVHKKAPSQELLNIYAKEWECNWNLFKVQEAMLIED